MEIKTNIWTVIEGELKEIKFNEEIFSVTKRRQVTKQTTLDDFSNLVEEKPFTNMHKTQVKDKNPKIKTKPIGKKIGKYGTNTMNLNVFNDVKKWMEEGLKRPEIGANIKQIYKPDVKLASCNALASFYMRYVNGVKPKSKIGLAKGKKVGSMGGNNMYENPCKEVKKALEKGKLWSEIRDKIIKKYYPNYNIFSLNSMTSLYKKFVIKGNYLSC